MTYARRIADHITNLSTPHVLCVGDVMLDRYVYGAVNRISPEAPVGILEISSEREMLGGAGNVVRNLCSLGATVTFFSVTGDDSEADVIETSLARESRCTAILVREAVRTTSVKRRYISHGQQLLRVDRESKSPIASATLEALLIEFRRSLPLCDAVVLSDYAKGLFSGNSAQRFIDLAIDCGKPVLVDPKGTMFTRYSRATILKPNLTELSGATGMPIEDDSGIVAAARAIIRDTGVISVVVTRGAGGITAISENGSIDHFPASAREVFDVSGAGDTVAATMACGLGSRVPLRDALYLANLAAGLVVAKMGTAVIGVKELLQEFRNRVASEQIRSQDDAELDLQWPDGRRLRLQRGNDSPRLF